MLLRVTRILTALIVTAGFVALAGPASADALSFTAANGIVYSVDDADLPAGATITDYTGTETTVDIPATVEHDGSTYDVITIGGQAFRWSGLTAVTIPDSVTTIGSDAFAGNALTSVAIPDSVTTIGSSAFGNNALTSVTIPDSVTAIGVYAFSTNVLTSVTIPDSVTSIEEGTFSYNALTTVVIPGSVTSIGVAAFQENLLTSVTIPDSVTAIGGAAFYDNALASVTIPDSVTAIRADTFANNALTSVTIPDSVTLIQFEAFARNALTTVTIPHSVTSIGDNAFGDNAGLTDVTFSGPPPTTITDAADTFASLGDADGLIVTYQPAYASPDYPGGFTQPTWHGYNTRAAVLDVTVSFDLNGHGDPIADQDTTTGKIVTEPTAPTETGWTFTGWYTDPALTTLYDFSTLLTDDLTLYAGWTAITPDPDPDPAPDPEPDPAPDLGAGGGGDVDDADDEVLPDTGSPVTIPLLAAALAAIGAGTVLLRRKA